jgi:hypothetical protein
MKACIASYFMPNINPKTVELQKKVVEKFNVSNHEHIVMRGEIPHGLFMDYMWTLNGSPVKTLEKQSIKKALDFDVILFLDIDCIPLSDNAIDQYLESAMSGKLVGNAQRSGHIQNDNHLFAAPSALAISKENFDKIGRPSALETSRGDVAEEYTYGAELHGIQLDLTLPISYDREVYRYEWETDKRPYWTLENNLPNYGLGTSYGDNNRSLFWHNFQIRVDGQQEKFWEKCEDLLNG